MGGALCAPPGLETQKKKPGRIGLRCFLLIRRTSAPFDTNCHIFKEEQDTAYNIIKKKWASILLSVSSPKQGSLLLTSGSMYKRKRAYHKFLIHKK